MLKFFAVVFLCYVAALFWVLFHFARHFLREKKEEERMVELKLENEICESIEASRELHKPRSSNLTLPVTPEAN